MKILSLIVILTSIVAIIFNNLDYVSIILLIMGTAFNLIGFKNNSVRKNYSLYLLWFVYWTSVIFMPTFNLVEPNMKDLYVAITPEWNDKILEFGITIYLITSFLFAFPTSKVKSLNYSFTPKIISLNLLRNIIISSIVLTVFCIITGLGRMGAEFVVLPFHLSGIINLLRSYFIPAFFCIAVENFTMRNQKIPREIWILYICWCLMEIIAWMSKSVFVLHLLPVMLYLFFYYKPKIKRVIKVVAPIFIFFIFLYPVIGIARSIVSADTMDVNAFKEAYNMSKQDETNKNPIIKPLNRTLSFGALYAQDYKFINSNDFFDFSLTPILFSCGGAAKFQTIFIDGFPEEAMHSSGTNGLIDPLLHGGKALLYLVIILNFFLARGIDSLYNKGYYSIVAILFIMYNSWVTFSNITTLYDAVGKQTYFINALCIFLAYKLNYSNKKIK